MDLGQQIKNKLKESNMSVPDLALIIGVPKDRIYKWQKGSKPSDMEDYMKVTKWLESVPHGTNKNEVSRQDPNPDPLYSTPNTSDPRQLPSRLSDPDRLLAEKDATIKRLESEITWLRAKLDRYDSFLSGNTLQSS